jgi:hypothetical protein
VVVLQEAEGQQMSFAFTPQYVDASPCQQVADAARQAGFPEFVIPVVVAISRAESGCRSDATNRTASEYSVGPMQINLMAHPEVSEDCARDFFCALRAAFRISGGGQDFSPWSVYTSGRYAQYMSLNPGSLGLSAATAGAYAAGGINRGVILALALVLIVIGVLAMRKGR